MHAAHGYFAPYHSGDVTRSPSTPGLPILEHMYTTHVPLHTRTTGCTKGYLLCLLHNHAVSGNAPPGYISSEAGKVRRPYASEYKEAVKNHMRDRVHSAQITQDISTGKASVMEMSQCASRTAYITGAPSCSTNAKHIVT